MGYHTNDMIRGVNHIIGMTLVLQQKETYLDNIFCYVIKHKKYGAQHVIIDMIKYKDYKSYSVLVSIRPS